MNNKKKVLVLILLLLVIAAVFGVSYFLRYNNYMDKIDKIKIENIDMSQIADGEYFGQCDVDFISVKVKVTVKDHIITDIDMEHFNDRGSAADIIIDKIIEEQQIAVDTVSSATNSSKAIMKAVNNALS